jgi:colanic acid/amylovoran biosynthesis glycosyltransferase
VADQIRLLYLVGQYPAINHSYLLAEVRHLRRLGFDVRVASISAPDRPVGKLSPAEKEEAARTYYVKSVSALKVVMLCASEFFHNPLRLVRGLAFAWRLARGNLRRTAYHFAYFAEAVLVGRYMSGLGIAHVHASFSATVALILSKIFPITMSFGVYGFGELHNPSETYLTERIKGAVFVRSISRHGRAQMMLSCNREEWPKLIYAPLGIDVSEFVPAQKLGVSSPPRILCVGRLAPEKGQSLLLEAAAVLKQAGCNVRLRFVGDGPDRDFLVRRANELGLVSGIDFLGWVNQEQLMAEYASADLVVLPSLAEGIPMVLMEAMAMQIPCVAPCITGIPELIEHDVDGMLYSVADVEDMARKIRSLLESPALMREIGERARLRVASDYDMARNAEYFARLLTARLGAVRDASDSSLG